MTNKKFDVTAIGNAIVDVIAQADDALLAAHSLPKGAMNLIDAGMAEKLYGVMGPGKEASGGSAGNTIAGIAMLGGKTAYIGKVADDQLGQVFAHDIRGFGQAFRDLQTLRRFEVDGQAALVPVAQQEQHGLAVDGFRIYATPLALKRAFHRFDRDDVGAQVTEDLHCHRPEQEMVETDHSNSFEEVHLFS